MFTSNTSTNVVPMRHTLQIRDVPGLGLNAYFAYNVVGYLGSGNVSYGAALTAVFIEGWIFLLLSVTGARAKLITFVPRSIALAMRAGACVPWGA